MKKINELNLIIYLYINLRMYIFCLEKASEPFNEGKLTPYLMLLKSSITVMMKSVFSLFIMLRWLENYFQGTSEVEKSEENLLIKEEQMGIDKLNFEELVWLVAATTDMIRTKLQHLQKNGWLVDVDGNKSMVLKNWFIAVQISQIDTIENLAGMLYDNFCETKSN